MFSVTNATCILRHTKKTSFETLVDHPCHEKLVSIALFNYTLSIYKQHYFWLRLSVLVFDANFKLRLFLRHSLLVLNPIQLSSLIWIHKNWFHCILIKYLSYHVYFCKKKSTSNLSNQWPQLFNFIAEKYE